MFWDNAGIHRAARIQRFCLEHRIRLIKNAPHRPDLNGIEEIWGHAKQYYRKRITWHRANDIPFDNAKLVDESLE